MNDVTIVLSIVQYRKWMYAFNPDFTDVDLMHGLFYKLVKEHDIIIRNWDYRWISDDVRQALYSKGVVELFQLQIPFHCKTLCKLQMYRKRAVVVLKG